MAKNNLPQNQRPSAPQPISEDLLAIFLSNQAKELEVRTHEIDLQKKNIDKSHEFACRSLEAQKQDRKEERDHKQKTKRDFFLLVGFVAILISAVIACALFTNKENIAMEIIKAIGFLVSGGTGGFFMGKSKGAENNQEEKSQ